MQVQKLQPTIARVAKNSATKKQLAAKNLSKVAFNNIKASVIMASLENAAAKTKANSVTSKNQPTSCISLWGDLLPMGFAC